MIKEGKKDTFETTERGAVLKLISFFGGQVNTAKALNIEQSAVSNWLKGKNKVSYFNAMKAEKLTNGAVRAVELCPILAELEDCAL